MTLSEELQWRGFVQDTTFSNLSELDGQTMTFYHGFDASAPSQTVGNLAGMMLDKVFMRHGYTAILLAGGATSLIGDPGGKDKERPMQSEETVAENVRAAEMQLQKVFSGHDFTLVNNLDWTKDMTLLSFLRDIGKHFPMTPLVQRDYISQRIGEGGSGISYTEFSYTLLQGMDYLHLFDTYGCSLQLGGSDQWGNCLSGVELIRRVRGAETHVITLPLVINKATGKKFGKSEEGAVWLDAGLTSPYKFYQFWLNASDDGVEDYLKIYTELDKPTIDALIEKHSAEPHLRIAQRRLAHEVTQLIHGKETMQLVERVTQIVFDSMGQNTLDDGIIRVLEEELPTIERSSEQIKDVSQILVDAQLASSKSEARTFLKSGAVKAGIKAEKIDENTDLSAFEENGIVILRRGKNTLAVVRLR